MEPNISHGIRKDESLLFACSMAAGGEFAFVLLGIAFTGGVLDQETGRTLTAVVAISMALTVGWRHMNSSISERKRSIASRSIPRWR